MTGPGVTSLADVRSHRATEAAVAHEAVADDARHVHADMSLERSRSDGHDAALASTHAPQYDDGPDAA